VNWRVARSLRAGCDVRVVHQLAPGGSSSSSSGPSVVGLWLIRRTEAYCTRPNRAVSRLCSGGCVGSDADCRRHYCGSSRVCVCVCVCRVAGDHDSPIHGRTSEHQVRVTPVCITSRAAFAPRLTPPLPCRMHARLHVIYDWCIYGR